MKKTDLEKNKGLKINSRLQQVQTPARFGEAATVPLDRREQRKHDQALGLVPFAVKLNGDLIKQIQQIATDKQQTLSEVTAELLLKVLSQ